jgi:hypothetical protein
MPILAIVRNYGPPRHGRISDHAELYDTTLPLHPRPAMTPEEIAAAIVAYAADDNEIVQIVIAIKAHLSGHDPIDELY